MRPLLLPKTLQLLAVLLTAGTGSSPRALAQEVVGTLTDVPDVNYSPTWQVSYRVSNLHFDRGEGFTIYFPAEHFSNLVVKSVPPGWDVLAVQPEPYGFYPLRGFVDALAITDAASLSDPFVVQFNWPYTTDLPRLQVFERYSLNGSFHITGTSTAVIPEVEAWSWTSMLLGLTLLVRHRSGHRRQVPISRPSPPGLTQAMGSQWSR